MAARPDIRHSEEPVMVLRRFGLSVLVSVAFAVPALLAQDAAPAKPKKPPISSQPLPDDDALLARRIDAQNRKLFQDGPPLEIELTSDFGSINRERTPNNGRQFPGVLTVGGASIPVNLGSRGHLRLKSSTCSFVPIK